jgi:hypothetical protein
MCPRPIKPILVPVVAVISASPFDRRLVAAAGFKVRRAADRDLGRRASRGCRGEASRSLALRGAARRRSLDNRARAALGSVPALVRIQSVRRETA